MKCKNICGYYITLTALVTVVQLSNMSLTIFSWAKESPLRVRTLMYESPFILKTFINCLFNQRAHKSPNSILVCINTQWQYIGTNKLIFKFSRFIILQCIKEVYSSLSFISTINKPPHFSANRSNACKHSAS